MLYIIIVYPMHSYGGQYYDQEGYMVNQSQVNLYRNVSSESQIDVWDELTCAEGFYIDNSSIDLHSPIMCLPLCQYWLSSSRTLGNTVVVEIIGLISAIVSSLIMIVLVVWLQRDTL